jgi:hypothetical protein
MAQSLGLNSILHGCQPPELTQEQIIRKPVPLDWDAPTRLCGFSQKQGHP